MKGESHLSDEELLLAIDDELDGARLAAAHAHLNSCWTCRARRAELEQAISSFAQVHRALDAHIPPAPGPEAKLRAELASLPQPFPPAVLWRAAAALLFVVGITWMVAQRGNTGPLPDPRLTPGATRSISRAQVCVLPADDDAMIVSTDAAGRVFKEYRIAPKPKAYEIDFLISPALGGADDIRNLWPQPYAQGKWNSRVKDALEDHLRHLVCDEGMDLATAQHEIASDWIAAYRKYFGTSQPIAAHALFVKDRPWE